MEEILSVIGIFFAPAIMIVLNGFSKRVTELPTPASIVVYFGVLSLLRLIGYSVTQAD